jgi:Fe2+/Zn2+ uptake regulation proteins
MGVLKYSRQREAIKHFLANTTMHPTADTVYAHIKEEFPNISLGTVYRNLSLLAEQGELQQLPCSNGADRFDFNTTSHAHFTCSKCHQVLDLDIPEQLQELNNAVADTFKGQIHTQHLMFHGLCPKCSRA